jgi:hypothetical protein
MAMSEQDKNRLQGLLDDAMEKVIGDADNEKVYHPYWDEGTAACMALAAFAVVLALDLTKEE